MRLPPLVRLAALGLATAAAPQAQDTRQFGDAVYAVPEGWRPAVYAADEDQPAHVGLIADGDDLPYARLLIFRDEPAPADLGAWLSAHARAWRGDGVVAEARESWIERADGTDAFMRAELEADVGGASGDRAETDPAVFAAVASGERAVWVVLTGWDGDALQAHLGTFATWFEALQLVSAGAAPLLAEARPGTLDGVYVGMGTTFGVNGPSIGLRYYVFSRDGWFYDGMPEGTSLLDFDIPQAADREPDEAGTYTLDGTTLTLRYADGETDALEAGPGDDGDGPDIELEGFGYVLTAPPPDGTVFGGTFQYGQYLTTDPLTTSSARTYEETYTFTPDGRFEATQFTFQSTQFDGVGFGGYVVGTNRPADVRGRYAVRDGALILTDADGAEIRLSVLRLGYDTLILDGDAYHRQ